MIVNPKVLVFIWIDFVRLKYNIIEVDIKIILSFIKLFRVVFINSKGLYLISLIMP